MGVLYSTLKYLGRYVVVGLCYRTVPMGNFDLL